eukprot:3377088-Rhodomonas_salina.3
MVAAQPSSVMVLKLVNNATPKLLKHVNPKSGHTGSSVSSPVAHGRAVPCRRQPVSPSTGSVYAYGRCSILPSPSTAGAHEHLKPSGHLYEPGVVPHSTGPGTAFSTTASVLCSRRSW